MDTNFSYPYYLVVARLICGLLRSTLNDEDDQLITYLFDEKMSLAETAIRLGATKDKVRHRRDRLLDEMHQTSIGTDLERLVRDYLEAEAA